MLLIFLHNEKEDDEVLALLSIIAQAASPDMLIDLICDTSLNTQIKTTTLILAERLKKWIVLVKVARDGGIPLESRVIAIHGLADNQRTAELREISEANEAPAALRALARKFLEPYHL